MEPAIFLDRDGTLIADDANAGHPASVVLLDGVPASLRRLRDAGFRLVVATNQGGVARGRFTEVDVDAVHRKIGDLIDAATGLTRGLVANHVLIPLLQSRYTRCARVYGLGFRV